MKAEISFEKSLNTFQLEAVMFNEGSLLVIAGAGSGKTRTLVYRVARLVKEGILPRSILLLTFTRRAAAEMIRRATMLLDDRCEKVSGGTFHSFANNILRQYSSKIGFPEGFEIIDRTDAEDLIGMIRKEMSLSSKSRSFPSKNTLMDIFSKAANKSLSIENTLYAEYPHFYQEVEEIIFLHNEYVKQKVRHWFLDYDDLLIYLKNLLNEYPDICHKISSYYKFIMVDEYQDTNKIQAEILFLLSTANKNIMAVGDDSQSIYAFRGANFKNIMDFPKNFKETKIIRLEENYRSIQPILTLTNVIIERASVKYKKELWTMKKGGAKPLLVRTHDEKEQSFFVIKTIKQLINKNVPLYHISVLFKAGFHSFGLEIELARENIAFKKVGGFKFIESAHIKDALAHLRVLAHPNDRISWHRILSLIDNIGHQKINVIYDIISRNKSGYLNLVNNKFPAAIEKHLCDIRGFFLDIHDKKPGVPELGDIVLKYYTPIMRKKFDDYPKRIKDLEQMIVIMERYHSLNDFLSDMALEPPNTSAGNILQASEVQNDDILTLSTIHSAKGLEWHTVFILWTLDGRFPSIHSLKDESLLEEERRLMYVAATRARENLFFIYPEEVYEKSSGIILSRPSRFLDNIPEEILEKRYF